MTQLVIVAAAIVDGDPPRVLAAQRSYPAGLAGFWELPGGKVDPGEEDTEALVRELKEELGVTVAPGERFGNDVVIPVGVLRVWWARIVDGTPQPLEHAALRWVAADELGELPWLPADAPVVDALRHSLRR